MKLFDLIKYNDYATAIADKLISVRDDGAGLRILNYTDAAMYTPGAWDNPAVRFCRGMIVDDQYEIRARPWVKFFNHGQAEAGDLDLTAPVEVTDKLDGSLGVIHLTNSGLPRVASRGSFESDQAIHATAVLLARYPGLSNLDWITPLVEIVYPANRIVCDYQDLDDLVLLGGVHIENGTYFGPRQTAARIGWTGPLTATFPYDTLAEALAAPERPGAEGLCVRYLHHDRIVKIKQADYVRLHRIVTGLSERTMWEHMVDERALYELLDGVPDELHPWIRDVWDRIVAETNRIYHHATDTHIAITKKIPVGFTRRMYAEHAVQYPDVRPYLFQILDGRSPRAAILRTLKPAGDTRARTISEAVA